MANMWTYFLHKKGEIINEDFDIYNMDKRELPSRRACKRASLKMLSPTVYSNAGVVEVNNLIYEKEFAVKGFLLPDNTDCNSPRKSIIGSDCSPLSPKRRNTQVSQDLSLENSPSKESPLKLNSIASKLSTGLVSGASGSIDSDKSVVNKL
jgi:hypothetical protein